MWLRSVEAAWGLGSCRQPLVCHSPAGRVCLLPHGSKGLGHVLHNEPHAAFWRCPTAQGGVGWPLCFPGERFSQGGPED